MTISTAWRLCALALMWTVLPVFVLCDFARNAWVLNRQALRWTWNEATRKVESLRAAWGYLLRGGK